MSPKQRLFPEEKPDESKPHERFESLAAKVLSVPKAEIDKRESDWQREHQQKRRAER